MILSLNLNLWIEINIDGKSSNNVFYSHILFDYYRYLANELGLTGQTPIHAAQVLLTLTFKESFKSDIVELLEIYRFFVTYPQLDITNISH